MKYNLSEINELIRNRRTIYPERFSTRKVHEEIVKNVLTNATWAPTHGMTQPWRFTVFTGDALISLSDFMSGLYTQLNLGLSFKQSKYDNFKNRPMAASVVVAVSMSRDPNEKIPEWEEMAAVACALQNMALTCTAYGLGSFWSTPELISRPEMKAHLNLGEKDRCMALFYIGYPQGEWPQGHRKPIEYVTEMRTA